jgi:hypothetical protein
LHDHEERERVDRREILRSMTVGMGTAFGVTAVGGSAAAATRDDPRDREAVIRLTPKDSIQAALDDGVQSLQLSPGDWRITAPIVARPGASITGSGQSSRLLATEKNLPAVLAIGNGKQCDGFVVSNLVVNANRLATTGIDLNPVGRGSYYEDEPDPMHRLVNLWVYDAVQDNIWYRGDSRATVTQLVRSRRAGRHAFHCVNSDSWWLACEGTTTRPGTDSAGFFVGSTNSFFVACKAWYCRDYGYLIRGSRNKFSVCESQDTRSHGWFIEYDKNVFNGCVADSAGFHDVGGTPKTADGFYVVGDNESQALIGCQAFDRLRSPHQRYGFNVPASMVDEGRLVAPTGFGNLGGLVNRRS